MMMMFVADGVSSKSVMLYSPLQNHSFLFVGIDPKLLVLTNLHLKTEETLWGRKARFAYIPSVP